MIFKFTFTKITISSDGYFEIDQVKSNILAPRIYKEKDGIVLLDRLARTEDLNDQSILCKLIDGIYYLGEVYFNETYDIDVLNGWCKDTSRLPIAKDIYVDLVAG